MESKPFNTLDISTCSLLNDHYGHSFILDGDNNEWGTWLICIAISIVYIVPMIYIFKHRNSLSLKTRSPKMILCALFCLMFDSILNTFVFAWSNNKRMSWTTSCDTGIFITVVLYQTALAFYFLRMFRI